MHIMKEYRKANQKLIFIIISLFIGLQTAGTMYVSAYLKLIGLSSADVGLFTSIRSAIGIVLPFVWGIICDKFQTVKKPFFVCLLFTIVIFPLIPLSETVFLLPITVIPWLTVISRMFYRPLGSIFETWAIQMSNQDDSLNYGHIKIFSQVGNLLGSSIISFLISYLSIRISFYFVGIVGCLACLFLPSAKDIKPIYSEHSSLRNLPIKEIFTNPYLLGYLVGISLNIISTCSSNNFMIYLLEDIGAGQEALGSFQLIKQLTTIPFMLLPIAFIKKLPKGLTITLIGLTIPIGDFLYANVASTGQMLVASIIANCLMGVRAILIANYLYEHSPAEIRNTSQMLVSTMGALSTIISSTIGGYMIDIYGIRSFIMVNCYVSIAGLAFFAICNLIGNRKAAK